MSGTPAFTAPPASRADDQDHLWALRSRFPEAMRRARQDLPPTVAALVVDELDFFSEMGYRFGGADRARRLVDELTRPLRVP